MDGISFPVAYIFKLKCELHSKMQEEMYSCWYIYLSLNSRMHTEPRICKFRFIFLQIRCASLDSHMEIGGLEIRLDLQMVLILYTVYRLVNTVLYLVFKMLHIILWYTVSFIRDFLPTLYIQQKALVTFNKSTGELHFSKTEVREKLHRISKTHCM